MARRVRFTVGRRSLASKKGMSPYEPGYTLAIRRQMESIENRITQALNAVEGVTPGAVRYALQPIFDTSQRLVPVDTGELAASGFIRIEEKAHGAVGVVGYAEGGHPFYAVIVHERTDLNHQAPTQAKFLEAAVSRHVDDVQRRALEYYRNELGFT